MTIDTTGLTAREYLRVSVDRSGTERSPEEQHAEHASWLAVAYADANEPEAAADIARRMFELSADVASDRTSERGRVVLGRLAEFEDVPEVAAVLAGHPPAA